LGSELKKQVDASRTVEEKLHAYIATKLLFFEQNRDFFKIYHAEFGNAIANPVHKDFSELLFKQLRLIKGILSEGLKQHKIREMRLELTAFAIFDITRVAITQRLLGYSKASIHEEMDFLQDFIWKGIAC
jgi:hypothetical protein